MKQWFGMAALLGWLLLTGCAGAAANATATSLPSLAGTTWQLTAYGDPVGPQPVLASHRPTLMFERDSAGGDTGCNSYGGDYTINGASLTFGALVQTERACLETEAMQQEASYLQLLQQVQSYNRTDDSLTLIGTGGVLIYTAAAPQ